MKWILTLDPGESWSKPSINNDHKFGHWPDVVLHRSAMGHRACGQGGADLALSRYDVKRPPTTLAVCRWMYLTAYGASGLAYGLQFFKDLTMPVLRLITFHGKKRKKRVSGTRSGFRT